MASTDPIGRRTAVSLLLAATAAPTSSVLAQVELLPSGDAAHENTAEAATREGAVVVWATTDEAEADDLLAGFRALYPGVRVEYVKMNSADLYDQFLSDAAAARGATGTADVLWSSAMDLQIKLVNDGYARPYASPETAALPGWAVWRDEAFGVTAEPVAFVYNRRLLPEARVPRTHAAFARELAADPEAWKGKVAAYDVERSGAGFLFLTQDVEATPRTWDLVRAMGQAGVKLYANTETMLDRVAGGEQLLAYDVLGSYAMERAKSEPALGVVLPSDYTIVVSRIALIPAAARHPNAARLFLDHLLSRDGQQQLAARSLTPVRPDARAGTELSGALRPIPVGPELMTYLDQIKRDRFLKQWRRAIEGR